MVVVWNSTIILIQVWDEKQMGLHAKDSAAVKSTEDLPSQSMSSVLQMRGSGLVGNDMVSTWCSPSVKSLFGKV